MVQQVVVPLRSGSDGDATHRPVGPGYTEVDPPTLYLEKIGNAWMKARGDALPGVSYILERLPAGYALFQKARPNNSQHVDKWLYGSPRNKAFDSPNRFYPHFEWMMDNDGDTIGCPCSVCVKGGVLHNSSSRVNSNHASRSSFSGSFKSSPPHAAPTRPIDSTPSTWVPAPQFKGRPKTVLPGMDASRVDEEGTPDVYRHLIDKLKRHRTVDEAIMEPMSMDWRAEQAILPELLAKVKEEAQWVPRVGDIVIYIRKFPDGLEILQNEETGEHQFYDPENETFAGAPVWEAGLVGQAPEESVDIDDAFQDGEKEYNVSVSGVRVEPLPNPNDKNKSLSKRYRYVPVSHTRPFFLWKEYVGHDDEEWHPTIKNALTAMATVSLMGTYRFRGEWPEAEIFCRGTFIGSEFMAVGDTVRVMPKDVEEECTDVMVITSIRLRFKNLDKASDNDYDHGKPYNSEIWILGRGYTTDASRSNEEWVCDKNIATPRAARSYPRWYPLHPATKELGVPFNRVLGRLYEYEAIQQWLPSTPTLDQGREGVIEAREFGRTHDNRIIEAPSCCLWFWSVSRAEALDIQTINGLEVGKYDTERDPSLWRKKIKLMDGVSKTQDQRENDHAAGSDAFKSLRSFMAPSSAAVPSSSAALPVRGQTLRRGDSSRSTSTVGAMAGQKRGQVFSVSDNEDDDEEIREHTRIIDDDLPTSSQSKKPRVMVYVE